MLPRHSSFISAESDDEFAIATGGDFASRSSLSLGGHNSDVERPLLSDDSGDEEQNEDDLHIHGSPRRALPSTGLLASSLDRSFAASYGTISSRVSESARRNAIQFHHEHQTYADGLDDPDREPLLLKHVQHEDGTKEDIVIGLSTVQ